MDNISLIITYIISYMNEEEKVESIRNFVFKHSDPDDIHGYKHTERVYTLSLMQL